MLRYVLCEPAAGSVLKRYAQASAAKSLVSTLSAAVCSSPCFRDRSPIALRIHFGMRYMAAFCEQFLAHNQPPPLCVCCMPLPTSSAGIISSRGEYMYSRGVATVSQGRRRGDDNVDLSVSMRVWGGAGGADRVLERRTRRSRVWRQWSIDTRRVRAAKARKAPRIEIPTIARRIGERMALENAAMVLDTPPFPGHESKTTRRGWVENGSKSDCGCDSARILESDVSCHDPPGVGLLSMKGR